MNTSIEFCIYLYNIGNTYATKLCHKKDNHAKGSSAKEVPIEGNTFLCLHLKPSSLSSSLRFRLCSPLIWKAVASCQSIWSHPHLHSFVRLYSWHHLGLWILNIMSPLSLINAFTQQHSTTPSFPFATQYNSQPPYLLLLPPYLFEEEQFIAANIPFYPHNDLCILSFPFHSALFIHCKHHWLGRWW